jgi:hypothetical protein
MSDATLSIRSTGIAPVALPSPRVPISVRLATIEDVPFLDSLQKLHTKQVGWMPTKQFEGKIKLGHVLIAEESRTADDADDADKKLNSSVLSVKSAVKSVGYCIGNDQYFKRDDCGIIYQLNVMPQKQRGFIGATLIKAMFDRAAYGCRLFCCWCAQDIRANHFWESIGFVPLAFRAGSRGKQRIHIFWQRRIREGDTTTPYWFPAQTSAGSIREDRLVLPIPPGTHWRDVMPIVLPQEKPVLEDRIPRQLRTLKVRKHPKTALGRLSFAAPKPAKEKPSKAQRQKVKNAPRLVSAARELRDRWLERVNELPLTSRGKYDIARLVDESLAQDSPRMPLLLPAA